MQDANGNRLWRDLINDTPIFNKAPACYFDLDMIEDDKCLL